MLRVDLGLGFIVLSPPLFAKEVGSMNFRGEEGNDGTRTKTQMEKGETRGKVKERKCLAEN